MSYFIIKGLHLLLVSVSVVGLVARILGQARGSDWASGIVARVLPHVIDTALLASGVWLILASGIYPWQQYWMFLKLVLLFFYVLFGTISLRSSRSPRRILFLAAALGVVGFMVVLATLKPF